MDPESYHRDIIVEVVDSSEIPESELKYFEETEPLLVEDIIIDDIKPSTTNTTTTTDPNFRIEESEEVLITKYVNGEMGFPDFYTKLDAEEEDEDEEILSMDDKISNNCQTSSGSQYSASCSFSNETNQTKGKRIHRKKTILNAVLQGLMGEANLCFVRGKIEMAEKICLEIIRQNPLASEPFFTLAQIYENRDEDKFLEFSTIAAHLDPTNRDQWIRIAEVNIEKKKYQEARVYYSKAIRFFPKDYELRIMKAKLLELMGDEKKTMYALMKAIALLPPEQSEYCLETAKKIARYFHEHHKLKYALEAMNGAYTVAAKIFTTDDINLYVELLLLNKFYHKALLVLKEFAKIEYIAEQDGDKTNVVACVFPDDMKQDLRVKACISLIHLKAFHLIPYITENVLTFISIENEIGISWYMDIVETLMTEEKYLETLTLLGKMIDGSQQQPACTWLKYAECHHILGNIPEAISSYNLVIEQAPNCYSAKFALSALLKQQGKYKEAIKALEQNLDADTFNPRLLYEHCLLLEASNEFDQYIEGGYILLARNSLKFRTRDELLTASFGANDYKSGTIKSIVEWRRDGSKEEAPDYKDNESALSIDEEYNIFRNIMQVCYQKRKFSMMQKLCFAIITTKKFRPKFKELEKLIVLSSLYNDDPLIAFMFLREILSRNIGKNIYWNIANLLIQKHDSVRYYRYFKRLLGRITTESYFKIFLANYHLSAGSFKYALNLYVAIFKDTNDPLIALCIAVVFSQMSTQKNSLKRQTAAAQAIVFGRKYSELRMSSMTAQEIYYNLGRLYHHAGLPYLAVKYYLQGLESHNDFIDEHENIVGLREEIAFNLHLIYKASGNLDMARKYLYKYVVV